jgi:hypothetical protein
VVRTQTGHAFGIAGISDHDGFDFLAAMERAICGVDDPRRVGEAFMADAGRCFANAYVEWAGSSAFGGQATQQFFTAIVAWCRMSEVSLWQLSTKLSFGVEGRPELLLLSDSPRPDEAAAVLVAGYGSMVRRHCLGVSPVGGSEGTDVEAVASV